jgi:hypothetical protein
MSSLLRPKKQKLECNSVRQFNEKSTEKYDDADLPESNAFKS